MFHLGVCRCGACACNCGARGGRKRPELRRHERLRHVRHRPRASARRLHARVLVLPCRHRRHRVDTGTGGVTAVPLVTKGRGEADGQHARHELLPRHPRHGQRAVRRLRGGHGADLAGLNHPAAGVTPIRNNTWYHAAATYDGTTVAALPEREPRGRGHRRREPAPQHLSIQHAGLATAHDLDGRGGRLLRRASSTRRASGTARAPRPRSRDSMYLEITSGTGLIGRWGLERGLAARPRPTRCAGGVNGTLTNGPAVGRGRARSPWPTRSSSASPTRYVTFGNPAALGLGGVHARVLVPARRDRRGHQHRHGRRSPRCRS